MTKTKLTKTRRETPIRKGERYCTIISQGHRKQELQGQYIYWGLVPGDALPA